MSAVCFWQLLLTFPTNKVEKMAVASGEKAAKGESDAIQKQLTARRYEGAFLDSVSNEPVFAGMTYSSLKRQQLALGLDLKGGMSVVLQIDLQDLIKERANNSQDPVFLKALADAKAAQKTSQNSFVELFADAFKANAGGRTLASIFSLNPALKDKVKFNSSDADVIAVLKKDATEIVDLTYKRLKQRIDKFGATQPNVTLDNRTSRIIVELPGVSNPERAHSFLQTSAKLEFWEVFLFPEISEGMMAANEALKGVDVEKTVVKTDSAGNVIPVASAPKDSNAMAVSLFKYLSVSNAPSAIIGTAKGSDTAKVNKMLAYPTVRGLFPKNLKFLWENSPNKDQATGKITKNYNLYAIKMQPGKTVARLEGDHIIQASHTTDQQSGGYVVNLSMDGEGSRTWAAMTREAAPTRREVAIVLDNEVVSAPHVNGEINGGNTQITGNFTSQEAEDLAGFLQIGKLPAKTEIVEEAIVGPTLGQENISSSMWAMGLAVLLVILFMIAYYSTAGVVAVVALIANFIFIVAAMSSFGTVLTVPGIAGMVLTISMAVDANIVIYERIREELRHGKGTIQAIRDGFTHSYAPIIDSHVTAGITAVILIYFGLGPIKGFGLVQFFGVVCTLFASLLVSRLVMEWWTEKGNELSYSTKFSERIFENMNIDFVGMRKYTYFFSGLFSVIAIVAMVYRGFDKGVDFTGGYSYAVKFDKSTSPDDVRNALTKTFGIEPTVKTFNTSNTLEITTQYKVDETNADNEVKAKLLEGLAQFGKSEITRSIKIGPTVADDIRNSSLITAVLAIGLIFLYLLLRFRKWQYSLGATVALLHDVIHTLGWFAIFWGIFPFSMQVDQAFIAAILTIIGYSMNDTVIVFDRIREYFNDDAYAHLSSKDVINKAINNTLNRTIITSLVTLITVVILFIFGGSVIKGFAFALVIGMLVGTYSSIFIATPIVVDFSSEEKTRMVKSTATEATTTV